MYHLEAAEIENVSVSSGESETSMLYYSSHETQAFINERPSTGSQVSSISMGEYLSRIFRWSQMDFQWAAWQMVKLCTEPALVAKYTKHRKQRKNQWARDDPAFVVILVFLLIISSTAYSIAFGANLKHWIWGVLKSVIIDFLAVGFVISSATWFIANNYLYRERLHAVQQKTEWLYSFDVHCNGYVPLFFLSHVLAFF
eukprot:UN34472